MDNCELIQMLQKMKIHKESYKLIAKALYTTGEKEPILTLFKHRISKQRSDLSDAERRIMMNSFSDLCQTLSKKIRIMQDLRDRSMNEEELDFLVSYIKKMKGDYVDLCFQFAGILTLLEPLAKNQEKKVGYLGITAAVYEKAATMELICGEKRNFSSIASKFYEKAKFVADTSLSPICYQRLILMAQYAEFKCTASGGKSRKGGLEIAKEALELAGEALQNHPENIPEDVQEALNRLSKIEKHF